MTLYQNLFQNLFARELEHIRKDFPIIDPKLIKFKNTYLKLSEKVIKCKIKKDEYYKTKVYQYTFERSLFEYKEILDFDIINKVPKIKYINDKYNRLDEELDNRMYKLNHYLRSNRLLLDKLNEQYILSLPKEEKIDKEENKKEEEKRSLNAIFRKLKNKFLMAKKLDGNKGYKNQYQFLKSFEDKEGQEKTGNRSSWLLHEFVNYLKLEKR